MPKPKKTPDIISATRHRDLFGSLAAFKSLDSWTAWLVWLKGVFALPMDDADLAIYRQCYRPHRSANRSSEKNIHGLGQALR